MEILLALVIIVLVVHSLVLKSSKKEIFQLKKRISHIESSPVEEGFKPSSTENIQSELPIEIQKETPQETDSPEIEAVPLVSPVSVNKNYKRKALILFKRFEHVFIESWIAVIAVIILVAGISFFGIWASTRISPVFRFWLIVGSSIIIGGLSVFAGRYEKFQSLAVWLRSAAAAVYLFAALGAGGIPGIQWIESPLMALLMLISGIFVNIMLAFIGKKQIFSSLHIILGIVAVSIAPQSVVTLIVATVITFSGIAISYRKKWDIHHLLSSLFYFGFIIFWGFNVDSYNNFYNISALSVIIVTSLITLFIHYRRIYSNSGFEVTPLVVHLVNWLFLSVGLIKFSPEIDYVYIPLFISGVLLFFLAGKAKKMKIGWLYATDTLISQLMILLAVISLINFDLSNMLILFLVLVESIGFLLIVWREKEYFVHTIALSVSSLAALALLATGLEEFLKYGSSEYWVYSGLFTLSAVSMSLYLMYISGTNIDSVLSGGKFRKKTLAFVHKANLSIQGFLIPIFVLGVYLLILFSDTIRGFLGPDTFVVPLFIALLTVKYRLKNLGMKIGIVIYIVLETAIALLYIAFEVDSSFVTMTIFSLPLVLMSLALVVYSLKKKGGIHERIPGIYLLTLHLLFISYFIFDGSRTLLSGLSWLFLALLFLISSNALKPGKLSEHMVVRLKKGLINGGYLFLISFVYRFLFFDIHKDTMLLVTVKAEYLLEIAAFTVMGLWFFLNKSRRLIDLFFLEIALVFLIIVLFFEVPVAILPLVFIVLSISLLLIGLIFNKNLSRLRIISVVPAWISAFLIAFVTSPYLTGSVSYTDTAWIMSAIGIFLQFIYLVLFHFSHKSDEISFPVKLLGLEKVMNKLVSGENIFLYYPVFAAVLFFFIWSFSGAVLTALISLEALLILVLSIVVKEDSFRYTALGGILVSIIRLVFFDLREAEIFVKAIAFIFVAVVMLLMNVLYNKFKERINEKTELK